jgi:hypothetical protein
MNPEDFEQAKKKLAVSLASFKEASVPIIARYRKLETEYLEPKGTLEPLDSVCHTADSAFHLHEFRQARC